MKLLFPRLPESRLNYTATIGDEFNGVSSLICGNPVFFLGNDAFIFETDLFLNGRESGMQLFRELNVLPKFPTDVHLYLFLLSEYSSKQFDGINAFADISKLLLSDYKVNLVVAKITRDQKRLVQVMDAPLGIGYQPIEKETIDIDKSGFMMKTPNGSNIFNMIITIGHYIILITVIMRGFISRDITTSIQETVRSVVKSGCFFRLPQEDVFIHFPWVEYKYDSLKEIMSSDFGFIYNLKQNDTMQRAFEKLEDQNILVNVRVIGTEKDF